MSLIYNGSEKPELDTRAQGTDLFTATANSTTSHYFTFNFDCELTGMELFAWNPNKGDKVTIFVEYNAGAYGWLRFKKFSKSFNVYPNHVNRAIAFPTLPKAGTRMRVDYTCGENSVDFSLNVFQYAVREDVNASLGQQGEDW